MSTLAYWLSHVIPGSQPRDYYPGALSLNLDTANSSVDLSPIDETSGCPIFKWVAET